MIDTAAMTDTQIDFLFKNLACSDNHILSNLKKNDCIV